MNAHDKQFKLISSLNTPRYIAGVMNIKDCLVVFGGYDSSFDHVDSIEKLNANG